MGGTSAQWTARRGTSWRPGGAEMRGRFRAARARLAATTPASPWTRSAIGSAWPTC